MKKAQFLERQLPVKKIVIKDKTYVFICIHEVRKEESRDDVMEPYYEYDYNEFCDFTKNIDLLDIDTYPEKYIDYRVTDSKESIEERIANLTSEIEKLQLDLDKMRSVSSN